MSGLRPLQQDDLEQVAALFMRLARPGSRQSVADIAAYFARTALHHPWADPELPSLVMADNHGTIVGFVGSYVARMRLDGQPIRALCPGNLVAAPDSRGFPPGALLLRELMNGPQDVTFVDTLGKQSRAMWEGLGGELATLGAFNWIRIFRPITLAQQRAMPARGGQTAARVASAVDSMLQRPVERLMPGLVKPSVPETSTEALNPSAMIAHWSSLTTRMRLHPDYEEGYLEWLLDELARPRRRGVLVGRLVRRGDRVLGWYVYYLKRGGISRALQVIGAEKDLGSIVDQLLLDAEAGGAAAIEGRLEPRLLKPLATRRCILRYGGASGMHTTNPHIRDAALSRRSVFTRMDSEYWPVPPRPV